MKILIVVHSLGGGGAERVAAVLANSFASLDHRVLIATNVGKGDPNIDYQISDKVDIVKCFGLHDDTPEGWKAFMLKHATFVYKSARYIRCWISMHSRLRKTIKRFKPDVVMGFMEPTSLQALVASFGLSCTVIATEHNAFERPESAPMTGKDKFFKFVVDKWFKVVTVLTEADREFIGDRLKRVYVMPNPLSFQPMFEKVEKRKRIVAAGRLDAWHYKGFDLLITAWGRIADKYPDWTMDIAGEYRENDSKLLLDRLIMENNLKGRCILSGFHKDIDNLFGESEIFVLSSRYEGFGMVLIEAMSQGCACIACDYKGRQREIIRNDEEGLCIPPESVDALVEAIERMINDEDYRRLIQSNAVSRSADFSPEIIARKWTDLFERITD